MCRPSILSLNTYMLSYGCHTHISFSYGIVRALFNLNRFPSLKWACMWSIECVCSSLRSVIVVIFFYWHCTRGSKWVSPRGFSSIEVYWNMSNSEHLSLFRSYFPCPNSESCAVCFVGFLIRQGGLKIHNYFQPLDQSI